MDHTSECQYWAVWALANLTRVYCKYTLLPFFCCSSFVNYFILSLPAEKYCRLLKEENGFQALEDLIQRTSNAKVRLFAKIALEESINYLQRNAVLGETSDDLEG